jgi:hypothetical protein
MAKERQPAGCAVGGGNSSVFFMVFSRSPLQTQPIIPTLAMTPDGTYAYVTVLGADRVDSTAASVTWDFYGHGTVVSTTPTVDTQFTS